MSASLQSLMRDQMAPTDTGTPVLVQLVAFIVIGGAAALSFVGVSSAAVALFRSVPAWLVSSLCYAAFIVPVYLMHRRYSFQSATAHGRALPRYVLVQLCGLALATAFSYLAYGIVGLPTLVAALVVIVLTSGVNFLVLRRWAFADGA
ncbi:MAG: GtrA family protein [Devosia sp.]|jgi:putative flippase GtrA|uniref:GtrA family protein n=1 Tax=Devosia sp. TaxID=1871048 RepID=UPI001A462A58|nr:GtrA family protein [Devosia sp.]MBL8597043.1 GtrA family protein [Devosia sp.]